MRFWGWILIIVGLCAFGFSWFMQVSVHSAAEFNGPLGYREATDTLNIGLLQQQLMVFQTGVGGIIAGSVFLAIAELRDAMYRAGSAKPEPRHEVQSANK